jgi:hypothetical protein
MAMDGVISISPLCAKGAHGFCTETAEGCGCTVCHFWCTRCGGACRRLYEDGTDLLCAGCYRAEVRGRPTPRCDFPGCSSRHAYRDPEYGDAYLCVPHHAARGHKIKV